MRTLRADFPDHSLCLIVGMDAFLGLPKWHQWRELLELAHLVVAHRPGWRAPSMGPLGELLVDRGTGRIDDLHESRAGCIYIHAVTQLEISSTEVRKLIAAGRDPRYLMPDARAGDHRANRDVIDPRGEHGRQARKDFTTCRFRSAEEPRPPKAPAESASSRRARRRRRRRPRQPPANVRRHADRRSCRSSRARSTR